MKLIWLGGGAGSRYKLGQYTCAVVSILPCYPSCAQYRGVVDWEWKLLGMGGGLRKVLLWNMFGCFQITLCSKVIHGDLNILFTMSDPLSVMQPALHRCDWPTTSCGRNDQQGIIITIITMQCNPGTTDEIGAEESYILVYRTIIIMLR